jgi:hypothetical protein
MTSEEMREMAREYANVDEVAATCLNVAADLTDTLVNEVNNLWREVKALRGEVGGLKKYRKSSSYPHGGVSR